MVGAISSARDSRFAAETAAVSRQATPNAPRDVEPAPVPALSLTPGREGKLIVPVRPAHTLFAAFKHIHVVPDWSLEQGIPLYKLTILDSLIERLVGGSVLPARADTASPETIDAVVSALSARLRAQAASAPFAAAANLPTGLVVDLVA